MVLRMAAALELDPGEEDTSTHAASGEAFAPLARDSRTLHSLIQATYVDYPVTAGLPA